VQAHNHLCSSLAALNHHIGASESYVRPTEDIFDLDSPKIKEVPFNSDAS
jgi:hypothetical protein